MQKNIKHAIMITSEDHLPRAMIVGNIVTGSRGIKLTTISIPCKDFCKEESFQKQLIDSVRALTWVVTGKDIKDIQNRNSSNLIQNKYFLF